MRRSLALGLLATTSPVASMAFGMRTLGRRIMMSAKGRGQLYDDITKTIGNTPVVKISDKMCVALLEPSLGLLRPPRRLLC